MTMGKKLGLVVALLCLSLVTTACGMARNGRHSESMETLMESRHQSKAANKQTVIAAVTDLVEVFVYYDNKVGNDGYLISDALDAEILPTVQTAIQTDLIDPKAKFESQETKAIKKLRAANISQTDVSNMVTNYRQIREVHKKSVEAMQGLTVDNAGQTAQNLSQIQTGLTSELNSDFSYAMMMVIYDAGYPEKEVSTEYSTILENAMRRYGDPADVAKIDAAQ